jgi:hypothetical protein
MRLYKDSVLISQHNLSPEPSPPIPPHDMARIEKKPPVKGVKLVWEAGAEGESINARIY